MNRQTAQLRHRIRVMEGKPSRAPVLFAAVALAVLAVLDLVTTRTILARGGVEANPLVAPWVGTPWFVFAKTVGISAVMIWAVVSIKTTWIARVLYGVAAAYAVVVTSNLIQLALETLG